MTQQAFANYIGLSTASLSSIFNDRTRPTLNTVEAIKNKFPNININWLMFGDGTMFNDEGNAEDKNPDNGARGNQQEIDFTPTPTDLFSNANDKNESSSSSRQMPKEVRTEIKYIEKPQRQITEIRVYFDDLTYETFVPDKK